MCSISYYVVVDSDFVISDISSLEEANEVASFWHTLLPSSDVVIYSKLFNNGLTNLSRVFEFRW